jgi:PelA/Pel-15E family pectate lyase
MPAAARSFPLLRPVRQEKMHGPQAGQGRSDLLTALVMLTVLAFAASVCPCAAAGPRDYLSKPDAWYQSAEGHRVTANILSWQSSRGSWPKNTDTTVPFTGRRTTLQGTFDNGATTDELRFLARAYRATGSRPCREAFLEGLAHILDAQYPTGGWPQFHPPSQYYHRHITFNDDAMVRLMRFLRDVATSSDYTFLGASPRQAAQASFDRGVQCILECQIVVNGKKTVWCAQHDERTLEPRGGRSYELVSLSGGESVGVLRLLMSIDDPSQPVVDAIVGGVQWYKSAKVTDPDRLRAIGVKTPGWARFYDIPTNRPIFSGRDGVKKFNLKEIERERAEGYSWWGQYGNAVAGEYRKWKQRHRRNPRILIQGTGIVPSELKAPLKFAYDSLGKRQYGPAAVVLKHILDEADEVGEKDLETARVIMTLVEKRAPVEIGRLESLEQVGDYYTLGVRLHAESRNLRGLPSFDEKWERWQAERDTKTWRQVIKAGQEFNQLVLAADYEVTPPIVKGLEDLAARYPDSLYGNAALDVLAKFKAGTRESASAIREAYFKQLMER